MHSKHFPNNSKNILKSGILYIVATPIGNMEDITIRAINTLNSVDLVAAEDTRHTKKLFAHYKINVPLMSFHEHNEFLKTPKIIDKLKQGFSVALVSDAGTPLFSDPGYRLVSEAAKNEIKIEPIPGASALIAALSASGMPTDSFIFIGFLTKKIKKRRKILKELANYTQTMVFYESPKRILTFMEELLDIIGDRYSVIARELTKIHEEFLRGRLSENISILKNREKIKGEITLIIKGKEDKDNIVEDCSLDAEIKKSLKKSSSKDTVKFISEKFNVSKKIIYSKILKIKGE
ncbi:MAG: 16S rRNA (cytidine(1402)-2'-O)-methyltransferase [Desulfobacterales bacterium]|nr:16S rRNA (cytidine(1402)-2'-O)-methyltransferase [Desulfobacterales bacterium]